MAALWLPPSFDPVVNQCFQIFEAPDILGVNQLKTGPALNSEKSVQNVWRSMHLFLPQSSSHVHVHVYIVVIVVIVVVVIVVVVGIAVAVDVGNDVSGEVEGDEQER